MRTLFLLLFAVSISSAEGPKFQHKETFTQQEFDNVYQDIRSVRRIISVSGTIVCIDNPTFCVDTANNRAGIGTATPAYVLDVNKGSAGAVARFTGSSDNGRGLSFTSADDGIFLGAIWTQDIASASGVYIWTIDSSTVMRISSAGEITKPLQPSFLATDATGATDVTGDGTAYTQLWPTEVYDQGGDFASNTFTAPVTGKYLLTASVRLQNIINTHTARFLQIVTSNRTYGKQIEELIENPNLVMTVSVVADMDANDTATVVVNVGGSTKTVDVRGGVDYNVFSGTLIN